MAICGNGIAASCCAKLLARRDLPFTFEADPNRTVRRPTLLINPQTHRLLNDVFEGGTALFPGAQPIRRRVVLWGITAREPQSFPHSGFAIRESQLLEILWGNIQHEAATHHGADWCIHSSHRGLDKTEQGRAEQDFGTRMAAAVNVQLQAHDNDACWIESLREGWLFLVPIGGGTGSLIAVGSSPARLLGESRLIGAQVAELLSEGVEFPAYPRIFTPLCGPGWLACGTAAMAFDPICGEGAGNAVREAILAAAVLGSIRSGAGGASTLGQYTLRMLAGFLRHLELCKQFYQSGRCSAWWDQEIEALERGLEWTRAQLAAAPSPTSRLVGFDLVETGQMR